MPVDGTTVAAWLIGAGAVGVISEVPIMLDGFCKFEDDAG
jgi:hypothetical protein